MFHVYPHRPETSLIVTGGRCCRWYEGLELYFSEDMRMARMISLGSILYFAWKGCQIRMGNVQIIQSESA